MTTPPKFWFPRSSSECGRQKTTSDELPAKSRRHHRRTGFSLVEVTIALGLMSYALLALLGLFTVGLSSSRDSSTETALSQIALHVTSSYSGTASALPLSYSYEGLAIVGTNSPLQKYYSVKVTTTPSDPTTIANTSTNLHLIKIAITSDYNPRVTNIIQTSAFVP